MSVHVGCSGWVYPDWRGVVYPTDVPQREWLELYAGRFDTVEVNSTFYRLPEPETVEGWASRVPPGFVFAPKVGQFCTHRKKLKDPDVWLPRHLDRVERFGAHLGPNLVQLPPNWKRNVDRLDAFLGVAPRTLRWAVEVRDPSWLHADVFDCLRRHAAALCLHDLLPDHPWELTAPWTYVRFHGPRALTNRYRGRYGPEALAASADVLRGWLADGVDVFAYFNNDFDGHAVEDAAWLRDTLASG